MAAAMKDDFVLTRYALGLSRTNFMMHPAIIATGLGIKSTGGRLTGEPCVKTFVPRKLPLNAIPTNLVIPGYIVTPRGTARTDVEEMVLPTSPPMPFVISAASAEWGRHRPFQVGDSMSHPRSPIGTAGAVMVDLRSPQDRYVLSCNHVLAALNTAQVGDWILQPATYDGGITWRDSCGLLERWSPIRFGFSGINLVDAAAALVLPGRNIVWRPDSTPVGTRSGASLAPQERVHKHGRTTQFTEGLVVATEVSGWISYPAALGNVTPAFFERQIVTTTMAAFGDSGSLLVDNQSNAVGLLFGGSNTHTFYNDIELVQNALGLTLLRV